MALSQKLDLRQGQSLVMSPQLQQAIKLLQLSNLELAAAIEEECERNPLLERDGDDGAASGSEDGPMDASAAETSMLEAPGAAAEDMDAAREDMAPDEPADFAPAIADGSRSDWSNIGAGLQHGDSDFEEMVAQVPSLAEHLRRQVSLAPLSDIERLVAIALIDEVDEWGYFRGDLRAIADRLGCSWLTAERTLKVMQGFEPTGVMARTISECLALQLAERGRLDPAMRALLDHLDLVARRDYPKLELLCGVDREDILDMIAEIKTLTPKPGLGFGAGEHGAIIPDVFVRQGPGGEWIIELNGDSLPRVLVNHAYQTKVLRSATRADDRERIQEWAQSANWLVKSLDQRARTILKVTSEIVRQQDAFLLRGIEWLRPLNLKIVANAVDMHESTVSRVTSGKYVATPRGIFELKYFFNGAVASNDGGDSLSAEAVRFKIKALIDQEAPHEALSDDRIVEILKDQGIDIARRTVAKYREAMNIPSSVLRRRLA